MPPKRSTEAGRAASASAWLVTSSLTTRRSSALPTASVTDSEWRPVATTAWPAARAALAMSTPMPRPVPVMNHTFFSLMSCPPFVVSASSYLLHCVRGVSGVKRRRRSVLLIGDVRAPGDGAALVVDLLQGEVGHEAGRRGAVPVVLARLEEHAVAGPDHLDRPTAPLAEADTLGDVDG